MPHPGRATEGHAGAVSGTTTLQSPWWRPSASVRARVLASVLLMALLGVSVAGGVAYVVQHRAIGGSVTDALEQEVQEFRTLADTGLDPQTGEPFTSIERLLRVALQRNVPDRHETYLAFLNGVPLAYNAGDRPIRLEAEPTVLAVVAALPPGSDVVITDIPTSVGVARAAIVPVGLSGQEDWGGSCSPTRWTGSSRSCSTSRASMPWSASVRWSWWGSSGGRWRVVCCGL